MSIKNEDMVTIGGADGPTAVFLINDKPHKLSFRQKVRKSVYDIRKKQAEKRIKADCHSLDEVIRYMKTKWGFEELSADSAEFKNEYSEARVSFIYRFRPELLGELAEMPSIRDPDEAAVNELLAEMDIRHNAAMNIPTDVFDIDFHVLKKHDSGNNIVITVEKNYGCIGGSVSGKGYKRRFEKILRDIYKYYGVTQYDIDNRTERYNELVMTLARM